MKAKKFIDGFIRNLTTYGVLAVLALAYFNSNSSSQPPHPQVQFYENINTKTGTWIPDEINQYHRGLNSILRDRDFNNDGKLDLYLLANDSTIFVPNIESGNSERISGGIER